jgi:hypothetical protein
MKTITISEDEYLQLCQTIEHSQQQLNLLQKQLRVPRILPSLGQSSEPVSLRRGSAKTIITYLADDFTAPLQDFEDHTAR